MPNLSQHLSQAKHNKDLLDALEDCDLKKDFCDWYVTISFYSALHFIEAAIHKIGFFSIRKNIGAPFSIQISHAIDACSYYGTNSPHKARLNILRDNRQHFGNIYADYRSMYDDSRTARYDCYERDPADCEPAWARLEHIENYVTEIVSN